MLAIGLTFCGGVAGTRRARAIPYLGGQAHDGRVRGEWRLHYPSPITWYIPKTAGPLSITLVGRVTDLKVFFFQVANPDRHCTCAKHTFYASRTLLGRLRPNLDIGSLTHSKQLPQPIFLVINAYAKFKFTRCSVLKSEMWWISTAVSYPTF